MLKFLQKFSIFCFLDNHEYDFNKSYECIAGSGVKASVVESENGFLNEINSFLAENRDWVFAHISYDVKNYFEDLTSSNEDGIQFPGYQFFVPEIVFILTKNEIQIGVFENYNSKLIFEEINLIIVDGLSTPALPQLKAKFTKEEYIATVNKLHHHILRGDCYEINFCQEFFANNVIINPLNVFKKLSDLSPNPFAAFYKFNNKYLLCASPERYLKKAGNTLISQPIKGTSQRYKKDINADEHQKKKLLNSEKERAENIMIVDLVRNDLSKICDEGSVNVKDFLKIHSFPQVHQMISTITGELKKNILFTEVLMATFPMGSMTGAPKKRVMELIEKYEKTKRGLFSGSVGYITPAGDFDFNVVIRSMLYNEAGKYLSIQSGSAITFKSDAENEYEECLLKIAVIKKALE